MPAIFRFLHPEHGQTDSRADGQMASSGQNPLRMNARHTRFCSTSSMSIRFISRSTAAIETSVEVSITRAASA